MIADLCKDVAVVVEAIISQYGSYREALSGQCGNEWVLAEPNTFIMLYEGGDPHLPAESAGRHAWIGEMDGADDYGIWFALDIDGHHVEARVSPRQTEEYGEPDEVIVGRLSSMTSKTRSTLMGRHWIFTNKHD